MSDRPKVSRLADGRWAAQCVPPCRARAVVDTWAEALALVPTFRHPQPPPRVVGRIDTTPYPNVLPGPPRRPGPGAQ